ncbi:helix-turn-helix domain-containing GNAT family N-acetyltransferase [Sneathiella marina]|uniref:Helix-turn-helix domain-containing GNAT family N-acetyltransferase n=1 Tax=Sneathiella marina TaxID=2950108 RepID=A0ABY4W4V3_9PROT|nr:helix-turn-helix domain-containing GNAT family N-acetyltransferase [Sneathiella marina]USG62220.1 helix-turn-helix domain-containing GNAT family N-acetyltransferase [Sneathiella marina]
MKNSLSDIDAIRHFNRFYTRHVGALNEGLLNSDFTLTEMRILYELYAGDNLTAASLNKDLSLDPAYLSRIIKKFKTKRLVKTAPNLSDRRKTILSLTNLGRATFIPFLKSSQKEVDTVLSRLTDPQKKELLRSMRSILSILGDDAPAPNPVLIRSHQPGDIGWIIHSHGKLYAEEYDFDGRFEAMVAQIAGNFLEDHNPDKEHCWVAEREGHILGSIFLVRKDDHTAKLRMLYVSAEARGEGVGRSLISECLNFARKAGYKKVTLWTNDILTAAIKLYIEAGFQLVHEEKHVSFGQELVGQTWDLTL